MVKSFKQFVNEQESVDEGVKSKLAAAALTAAIAGHHAPAHSFVGMPIPPNPTTKSVAVKQPDGSVILKHVKQQDSKKDVKPQDDKKK